MAAKVAATTLADMELIKIGVVHEKTVLELVLETANRQLAEIEQLKAAALQRSRSRRIRQPSRRCSSSRRESSMPGYGDLQAASL